MEVTKKIAIAIPTYGTIKTKTVHSLFKLVKNLSYEWNLLTQTGCYLQDNRENLVIMAKKLSCSHILFVDWDMEFEYEAAERLIRDERDIVGADYHYRKLPLESTVRKEDPDGTKIWKEHEDGIAECIAVGMGLTLIDLKVFDTLSHPWFFVEHDGQGSLKYGEDMWFCKKAREAGYKIWCDTTISIKHHGDYAY